MDWKFTKVKTTHKKMLLFPSHRVFESPSWEDTVDKDWGRRLGYSWANALKDTNKMLDTEAHQTSRNGEGRGRRRHWAVLCPMPMGGEDTFQDVPGDALSEAQARTVASKVCQRRLSSGTQGECLRWVRTRNGEKHPGWASDLRNMLRTWGFFWRPGRTVDRLWEGN